MLVLRRQISEEIIIEVAGIQITVTLVDTIGAGRARIGFEAPRDVRIHRKEIFESIQREGDHTKQKPEVRPLIKIGDPL